MSAVIGSIEEASNNIKLFNKELRSFKKNKDIDIKVLIDNIPNVRAWYVLEEDGSYIFAPSKYIGYKNMNANTYCENRKELDGRKTENALSNYYQQVPSPKLESELRDFCSRYDKSPNSLFRINIPLEIQEEDKLEVDVTELIWKVYLGLNTKNMELLKAKICRHKIKK